MGYLVHMTGEDSNYIAHYGIQGQKWGVRRFQNEDGSLTPEGKARYYKNYDHTRNLERSARPGSAKEQVMKMYESQKSEGLKNIESQIKNINQKMQDYQEKNYNNIDSEWDMIRPDQLNKYEKVLNNYRNQLRELDNARRETLSSEWYRDQYIADMQRADDFDTDPKRAARKYKRDIQLGR